MSDTTFLISGGFFDAVDSDRLYSADQMNQPYKKLIHDGINREADGTTPGFAVTAGGGMNVLVATGNAMIGGKWAENKAVQTIAVAGNTSGSARIDSIILQCDKSRAVRAVQIVYRQGTTAAPDLVSDDDITELRLANIRVPSAVSSIASENITDTRGGAECPWVRSVFDAPDARYIVEEYTGSELAGAYQTVKSAVDSIRYAAQSGQPTVALQASDMIDSNLVYLYQGSETGYSTGYLYYYSDAAGAWIRGAQYGASVVDTALDEDSENPVQNKAIAVAIKTVRSFVVEVPGSAAAFSGSIAAGDFAKALATYTAGSGVYAVKDGEVYQLSAASSSTMTFTQMYHGTMNFIKQIQITSADTFTVTNTALSSSAADTSYNNTTSGLTATDVQAAIDENAAAVTNVNGRLVQYSNDITQLAEDGRTNLVADFINGSLSSGVVNPSITYRVTSDHLFVFDRDVVLTPDDGFRFGIHSFGTDGAAFVSDSGWKTSAYTIAAGTYFKIVIQETAVTSGVADITKNVSAVKISTFISDSFRKVDADIDLVKTATVEYTEPQNLHNPAEDVNGALFYNGKEINTNDTSCITSGFIPVNEGDTVYYTAIGANGNYIGTGSTNMRWLAFYADADMTRALSCNSYQRNAVAPAGARYLRASFSDKTRRLHSITINSFPASLSQMENYFDPYYRNVAKPIVDEKVIDCWGDSRTAMSNDGTSFTDYLQTLLGNAYNVCNYGITSQSSGNVAMRLGANEVFVSLANNQIPTSGAVALSALRSMASDNFSVYAFSADAMSPCIIGGVRGRLNRSNTGDIAENTFVRDCDGVAVSVRPYTKVCVDDMGSNHHMCIFWWGKNDFSKYQGTTPNTQILDNYAAAVRYINHDRFIILGETCSIGSDYERGANKRTMLDALNTELAAKYPNNFIDINAWLSSEEALTSVGLTLTDTDSEYIAKGWPCYQLMRYSTISSDTVHPNEKGREAIANRIYAWLREKYWV